MGTAATVGSLRPTIVIEGQQHPKTRELLVGLEMLEHEGGMSQAELRFTNVASRGHGAAAFAFEDGAILKLGAALTLYAGDADGPFEIFRGTVTGLEAHYSLKGSPELVVLAEDALQRARLARRTKIYESISIAELAEALARLCGLKPVVTGFSEKIGPEVQLNESDLAFLRRLVRRYDGDLQAVGEELHVSPRGEVHRQTVALRMFEGLHSVRALADLSHQVTSVSLAGWDAAKGSRISVTSSGAVAGPGQGLTGPGALGQTPFGSRAHHLGHLEARDETEARAAADAAFDARARRFVTLEATAVGDPVIRVGTHVAIAGLGPRFDNTYYVVEARHRFGRRASGYRTEFVGECAFLGAG
ncbi:MAG: phage late control D family protein [Gemmatimonadales bacterium]